MTASPTAPTRPIGPGGLVVAVGAHQVVAAHRDRHQCRHRGDERELVLQHVGSHGPIAG
jgi:hypothetical protein